MYRLLFTHAVRELFPDVDNETIQEIIENATVYLGEFIKNQVFKTDPSQLEDMNKTLVNNPDKNQAATQFAQAIYDKLSSLPSAIQEEIFERANQELTRKMHGIYLSYINK